MAWRLMARSAASCWRAGMRGPEIRWCWQGILVRETDLPRRWASSAPAMPTRRRATGRIYAGLTRQKQNPRRDKNESPLFYAGFGNGSSGRGCAGNERIVADGRFFDGGRAVAAIGVVFVLHHAVDGVRE